MNINDNSPKRRGRKPKNYNIDNNDNDYGNNDYGSGSDYSEDDDFETQSVNDAQSGITDDGINIYDTEIPSDEINPLEGQTIKREYANYSDPNAIDPNIPDLDEMEINPTDPNDILDGEDSIGGDGDFKKEKSKFDTLGEDLNLGDANELSDREQTLLAENTADTVFEAFDQVHALGRWLAKISDEKLIEMHRKGDIDLQTLVSDENGNPVTIAEVFQGLNKNIDNVLVLDDDFKDKYKPALIREIKKRKLFMTDSTYLAIGFGKAFVELGVATFSLKYSMNKQLKFFEAMHKETLEEMKRANDLKEQELSIKRESSKVKINTNLESVTAEIIDESNDFTAETTR